MTTTKPTPSKYQQAIYDAIENSVSNIAVVATAGAGKTTTLIGILERLPKYKTKRFLSFSNAIVDDLKKKVPILLTDYVSTVHSLGLRLIRDYFRGTYVTVEKDKYFKLASALYKETKADKKAYLTKEEFKSAMRVQDICSFARMTLTPHSEEELRLMCNHYAIAYDETILQYSMKLLKQSLIGKGKALWVDFADMVYFPARIPQMVTEKYDYILLDEAQDTNNAQLALVENLINPNGGRLISVGDDFQSIYGFQGSNIDSFKKIRQRPDTIVLPLTVSYRCPKRVVAKAKEVCPDIEAWEGAKEGVERRGHWTEIMEGDMVLSRTTKPLVELYFQLIEEGIKAKVIGKDTEQGLIDLAETCMAPTVQGMKIKLDMEFKKLEDSLTKLGIRTPQMHPSFDALTEKYELLMLILRKVNNETKKLISTIKKIFSEEKDAVRLMTIHRSKGLECDRVFVIDSYKGEKLMPHKRALLDWQKVQETNLMFVARTRSKEALIWIELRPQEVEDVETEEDDE